MKLITLGKSTFLSLINVGFHLGASSRRWFNRNSYFLLSCRSGYFFFNLSKTDFYFRRASLFLKQIYLTRGLLLIPVAQNSPYRKHFYRYRNSFIHPVELIARGGGGVLTNRFSTLSRTLKRLPSAVLILNSTDTPYLAKEATYLSIPTIGIVDSNMDPSSFTYPIPGNNDSIPSALYLLSTLIGGRVGRKTELQSLVRSKGGRWNRVDRR